VTVIPWTRVLAAAVGLVMLILPSLAVALIGFAPPCNLPSGDEEKTAFALANTAPSFALTPPLYIYPTADVPFNMSIKVADANNDTVNVTWEWGDGTPNATDLTPPALTAVWVNQTHVWSIEREPGLGDYYAGPFVLNITLDDGMGGTARRQSYASVYVPPNEGPEMELSAPERVDPGDAVMIVANASDPEGDPLTWTFVFNNSVTDFHTEVFHTPATAPNEEVWNNLTYVFGAEGNYTIRLNVSDALPPNQVWPHNISLTVSVRAILNLPPEVVGVIDTDPQSLIINAILGYLNVSYSVEAFDPDGDVLHVVWDFGDGSPSVTNVSEGGTEVRAFVQQRNYTDPGTFNISVEVSDGRPGHNISLWKEVEITSNNLPPKVVGFVFNYSENRSYALPNETIAFTLVLADPELNAIEIIVDFGDNSTLEYYNLTEFSHGNVTLVLNHSFGSAGEYQITIWYTDNKTGLFEHAKYYNVTVTVKEAPPVIHDYWTPWDYTCLSVLICAIVLPVLWAINGIQKKRRMEMDASLLAGGLEPFREESDRAMHKERKRG
jgi:hypothetical protein